MELLTQSLRPSGEHPPIRATPEPTTGSSTNQRSTYANNGLVHQSEPNLSQPWAPVIEKLLSLLIRWASYPHTSTSNGANATIKRPLINRGHLHLPVSCSQKDLFTQTLLLLTQSSTLCFPKSSSHLSNTEKKERKKCTRYNDQKAPVGFYYVFQIFLTATHSKKYILTSNLVKHTYKRN